MDFEPGEVSAPDGQEDEEENLGNIDEEKMEASPGVDADPEVVIDGQFDDALAIESLSSPDEPVPLSEKLPDSPVDVLMSLMLGVDDRGG